MPENFMMYVSAGLAFLVMVVYAIRFGRRILAPVTVVDATVVSKQKVETFSKHSGTGKHTKCAVTFRAKGKNISFYVSDFSYGGYKIGQSATLTYKADRLIDFS